MAEIGYTRVGPIRQEHRSLLTNPHKHRWLLVTGTPRSGTTFLGDMLSQPLSVNPFVEPFNPHGGVPWIHQRYLYHPGVDALDAQTRARFEDFFSYRFTQQTYVHSLDPHLKKLRKRIFMGGNQWLVMRGKLNPFARFSLIKDPIAVFLTDVLLDFRPIHVFALIRHPLSYVGSLKRLGWNFDLEPLLAQPELMSRYLHDFEERSTGPLTPMKCAAWIWLAINRYILDVAERRPGIDVVFLEELSLRPMEWIKWCYGRAGLTWDARKAACVRALTQGGDKSRPREGVPHDLRRKSTDIFAQSISMVTEDERKAVISIVEPLVTQLYEDPLEPQLSSRGQDLMATA